MQANSCERNWREANSFIVDLMNCKRQVKGEQREVRWYKLTFFALHLPHLLAPSSSLRLNNEYDLFCTNIMLPYYEHTFT